MIMSSSVDNGIVVLSPLDIVNVITKRWRTVVFAFLAFVVSGAVYVFMLADESYTAKGRLVVENAPSVNSEVAPHSTKVDEAVVYTRAESLESADLLEHVQTRLVEEGLLNAPKQGTGGSRPLQNEPFTRAMQKRLKVGVDDDSHVITVSYEDVDRLRAKRVLEVLFDAYISREIKRKAAANKSAREQFQQRLGTLKKALEEANRRIAEQATATGVYKAGGGTLLSSSIESTSTQLNALEDKVTGLSSRIYMASQALKEGNWADVSPTIETPVMQKLLEAEADVKINADVTGSGPRTENYPSNVAKKAKLAALDRLMEEEFRKEIRVLEEDHSHLMDENSRLAKRLADLNQRNANEIRGTVLLTQLQRRAESLRDMFAVVQGRLYDTEVVPQADVWIMDNPKVGTLPTSPRKGVTLGASGFLGLMFGIVWALAGEGRQRAKNAVVGFVDADAPPAYWALPKLQSNGFVRDGVVNGSESLVARRWEETLRAIGYRLASTLDQSCGQAIAILSAEAGEGKTLFSVTLGRSLASEGHRVLLVDCDLRKPDVKNVVGCGFDGSLGDCLKHGVRRWSEDVTEDRITGLQVLAPAAATVPPTTVLGGRRINTFLREATKSYDFVILDTSPLLKVADGVVIMKDVDRGILVHNEKRAAGTEARSALESLGYPVKRITGIVAMGGKRESPGKLAYYGY